MVTESVRASRRRKPMVSAVSVTYDGDGRRVRKATSNGEVTVFVYDAAGRAVAEYSNQVEAKGTSYLTQDTLGSTRAVTDKDGAVKSRHDYFPFGEEIAATSRQGAQGYGPADNVRQKFTGYEHDDETSLDFAEARYYVSVQGRFSSPDPLLTSAKPEAPGTWNRYAYVLNNPLVLSDPQGLYVFDKKVSQTEQEQFNAALEEARNKLEEYGKKYGTNTDEYKKAKRALDVYGEKDKDNGVIIFVKDGKGGGRVDPLATKRINVEFDTATFSHSNFADLIGHEGVHAADKRDWIDSGFNANKNPQLYAGELNGYIVQALIAQARFPDRNSYLTLPYAKLPGKNPYLYEDLDIWNPSWKEADVATLRRTNINAYLARPTNAGGIYGLTPSSPQKTFAQPRRKRK